MVPALRESSRQYLPKDPNNVLDVHMMSDVVDGAAVVGAAVVVVPFGAAVVTVGAGVAVELAVTLQRAASSTLYGMRGTMAASSSKVLSTLNLSKILSGVLVPRTTANPISDSMKNNPTAQHVRSQQKAISGCSGAGGPQQYGSTGWPYC